MLIYYSQQRYCMQCSFKERNIPKDNHWSWDQGARIWYTDDLSKVVDLQDQADFTPYIKEEVRQYYQNLEDSRAAAVKLAVPAPPDLEYMPFQKAGIAYANNRPATLLADDMGLGKTVQTIGLLNLHPEFKSVLVVCPASLMLNWVHELKTWLVKKDWSIQCIGAVKNGWGSPRADLKIVICNYSGLSRLPRIKWDAVAIDEAQYMKNPESIRAKRVHEINAPYKLALTGTPFENRPKEIWSILHWLDPKTYKEFESFGFRYCAPFRMQMGPVVKWNYDGHSNLSELSTRLRSTLMIRRKKDEVLTELPDKTRQLIELGEGKDKISTLIDKCKELFAKKKQAKFESDISKLEEEERVIFSQVSTQRLEDGLVKVPLILKHVKQLLAKDQKVVIAAVHKEVIQQLYEGLRNYSPVKITGDTPVPHRDMVVTRFQTDPDCHVFIGQIRSAGVGLTLTAASTMVIVELDWNPAVMRQMEDRIYRIGQANAVLIQYLVLSKSLDAIMAKAMVRKNKIFEEGLDWIEEVADANDN